MSSIWQPAGQPSSLINIGTIRGAEASNVIAEEVELSGTVRSLNPKEGSAKDAMSRIVTGSPESWGGFDLDYRDGYLR